MSGKTTPEYFVARLLNTTDRVAVKMESAVGQYAVHPFVMMGKAQGPGYAISHWPSGIVVWSTEKFDDALKVAMHLDEKKHFPEDAKGFEDFRANLTGQQITKYMNMLAEICPRYYPPSYLAQINP